MHVGNSGGTESKRNRVLFFRVPIRYQSRRDKLLHLIFWIEFCQMSLPGFRRSAGSKSSFSLFGRMPDGKTETLLTMSNFQFCKRHNFTNSQSAQGTEDGMQIYHGFSQTQTEFRRNQSDTRYTSASCTPTQSRMDTRAQHSRTVQNVYFLAFHRRGVKAKGPKCQSTLTKLQNNPRIGICEALCVSVGRLCEVRRVWPARTPRCFCSATALFACQSTVTSQPAHQPPNGRHIAA